MQLKEILASEDFILLDGSISNPGKSLSWEIYSSTNYSYLDTERLEQEMPGLEEFREILLNPNVFTISEIAKEIEGYEKTLNAKIKKFSSNSIPKNRKRRTKQKNRNKEPRRLIHELQQTVYKTRLLAEAKAKLIKTGPEFDLLLDMVKLIEKEIELKKDPGYIRGERDYDKSENSDTDERLVAKILYFSLFSNKSPCLLAADKDFRNMLGVVPRLIGSDSFLPYNQKFRQKLIENPFRLYFKKAGNIGYEIKINSREMNYDRFFEIRNVSRGKSYSIGFQILDMWKQMCKSPLYNPVGLKNMGLEEPSSDKNHEQSPVLAQTPTHLS